MNIENFKISSALKSLIGRDLITDEFVAIFELVKNSFDANATEVTVKFENNKSRNNSRIIIYDNGVGMDISDLRNKWLFVAYSTKRGSIGNDYRDKIKTKRIFAGAKGVGRFSCDRLGKKLTLISIKKEKPSKIERLQLNWEDFEKDSTEEFFKIDVSHDSLTSHNYPINFGTILEISDLRDEWDRQKILKLKKSLEKLINPNQENDSGNFKILIEAPDETKEDENIKQEIKVLEDVLRNNGGDATGNNNKKISEKYRDIVNGSIKNFLFETLILKTTQIEIDVSSDGNIIESTLSDRGRRIYTIKESNSFQADSEKLHSIKIQLFQLNKSAKDNFTRMMGTENKKYGGVFLYKNGFRVLPYGEEGDDSLGIDKRKVQGYNRFLATRDLFGRIEIYGENTEFREVTSRDGGLVRNGHYYQLLDLFEEKALKRLEKYVVDVISWGDPREDKETKVTLPELKPEDVKEKVLEVISGLANSKDFISVDYDKDFFDILEQRQEKSVSKVIKNFEKAAIRTGDDNLRKDVEKLKREFKKIIQDTKTSEKKAEAADTRAGEAEEKLELTIGQNYFLKSAVTKDTKEILSLLHHIDHSTNRVNERVGDLIRAIERDDSKENLLKFIQFISIENNKISAFSKYYKKTNFNSEVVKINKNLVEFINEYLENVYKLYEHLKLNKQTLYITIQDPNNITFVRKFRPIEMTIVIDNILDNATKAKAKNVIFRWEKKSESNIELHILNDGHGIPDKFTNNIFDFGFSTTDGSGLGLYHVSEVLKDMNADIQLNNKVEKGVEFIITFNK